MVINLIAVSKTTHTTHDTEDIVVDSEDLDNTGFHSGVTLEGKSGVIDTGEIAGTRWLMLFGLKGEGIDVDFLLVGGTKSRAVTSSTGVVKVRLDVEEVFGLLFGKSVVSVKLELGVMESKLGITITAEVKDWAAGMMENPDKFLARVVEVKVNFLAGGSSKRFITGELNLFDEVFVRNLSETTTFISIKVDVVNPER